MSSLNDALEEVGTPKRNRQTFGRKDIPITTYPPAFQSGV